MTKQTRRASFIEAWANIGVGYGVAIFGQILIFPLFGIHTTLAEHLSIGGLFTVLSLVRSYMLRRVFEALRINGVLK